MEGTIGFGGILQILREVVNVNLSILKMHFFYSLHDRIPSIDYDAPIRP